MTSPLPSLADQLLREADQAYRTGAVGRALELTTRACEVAPNHRDPWLLRADIARRTTDMSELELSLGRAAALMPAEDRPRLLIHRAWALHALGRIGDAYQQAKALASLPVSPLLARDLGALLDLVGAAELAMIQIRAAAEREPDSADSWHDMALIHRSLGQSAEAAAAADRAVTLNPALAATHNLLAALKRWSPQDNHLPRLRAALATAREPLDRARLGYAIFKEADDLGETDEAWTAVQQAGRDAKAAFPWSAAREREAFRTLRDLFPNPPPAAFPQASQRPRPVFVVGLPRSGTTLVERVLSAHSQVRALGELNAFGQLSDPRPDQKPWPYADRAAIERLRGVEWRRVGELYRTQVGLLSEGAAVVVDKNPQNWVFAGAIARALPDALIVHVARDPMDSLFGAYKQLFLREHAWSFDLDSLAEHYAHYTALAAHWRETLGDRWIDVSYEALASDPAAVVPDLLSRLGLPMEPACLAPEAAEGGVRTLSSIQVREPINTRSIGGWRRYADGLEPLRRRLLDAGLINEDGTASGRIDPQVFAGA